MSVPTAGTGPVSDPPVELAIDLWMAVGCDEADFAAYYDRNGWADTWSNLVHEVSVLAGAQPCGKPVDGETCVLLEHNDAWPCYGQSDVGYSEPLPL